MKNFTLKLQIWLGFGLILGLIAVIAVTSIYYSKQVDYIVSEAQPSTLDTLIIWVVSLICIKDNAVQFQ